MSGPPVRIPHLTWPAQEIADFCQRRKITRLELFGSALRDDFSPVSDVHFPLTSDPEARWTLLAEVAVEDELASIFGRKVDLVSRGAVERSPNWIRRKHILETARVMYEP